MLHSGKKSNLSERVIHSFCNNRGHEKNLDKVLHEQCKRCPRRINIV